MSKKRIRWSIEKIKPILEQENFTLLSNEYINTKAKLRVRCPKGHNLQISWQSFLEGHRCKYCKWEDQKVKYDFIKEGFAKEGYIIVEGQDLKDTIKAATMVGVECPNGHKIKISWSRFKDQGIRCKECFLNRRRRNYVDIKSFIENQGYTLLTENYENCKEKLDVLCPQGHKWSVRWNDFQQGYRCSHCFVRQSKSEKELIALYKNFPLVESDKSVLNGKELDLYFPTHRLAIEYCGLYWHSDQHDRITPSYHRKKLDCCTQKGIRLLTIFEDEWICNKDICMSRIDNALGCIKKKIYARKCEVQEIDKKIAKSFLKRTHLQGYGSCRICFGLFYQNKLVQVMTFGTPNRQHTTRNKKVLEMKRLAAELNTIVIGGASKLFKAGLRYAQRYEFNIVKSYCDLRWGTGQLYQKLGFKKGYESKYTPHYTDGVNRYRNQSFAGNRNSTEKQKVQKKGLWKIYDCGHSTWEYEI